MKRHLSLLAVIFLLITPAAHADILIEPVLGYNLGTKLESDRDGTKEDYSGSGIGYGGRLGFQKLGFQLGVDYLASSINIDDNDFDSNLDTTEWAGFVGYEFPVFIRVYAGYIFSAIGKYESNTGSDIELSKGSGTKFGIGFTGLPIIDINIEYRSGTFDKFEADGTEASDFSADYRTVFLSLSAPFTF